MLNKIIQFQVVPVENGRYTIFALDAEGKLWVSSGGDRNTGLTWTQINTM